MVGPLFQWSLDTVGWRETHRLGSVAAFLIAIPTGLFIFHTPESVGYAERLVSPKRVWKWSRW